VSKRLTEAEIAEVWQRRNAGEPTQPMARRLRRNGSSIRRLFEDAGGVHPAPWKRSVRHLSLHDSWSAIDRHVSSGLVKPPISNRPGFDGDSFYWFPIVPLVAV